MATRKWPDIPGHVPVIPNRHFENIYDLPVAIAGEIHWLSVQRMVYDVAEAIRRTVETERVYLLSLGSHRGNRHVHWHIAPLPDGVPFKQQQLEALRVENKILDMRIRQSLERSITRTEPNNYQVTEGIKNNDNSIRTQDTFRR